MEHMIRPFIESLNDCDQEEGHEEKKHLLMISSDSAIMLALKTNMGAWKMHALKSLKGNKSIYKPPMVYYTRKSTKTVYTPENQRGYVVHLKIIPLEKEKHQSKPPIFSFNVRKFQGWQFPDGFYGFVL